MSKIVKVSLELPEEVAHQARALAESRAHEAAVLALWEEGELSASRAAEELDLGIHDFLDLLAAKGIPVESGPLSLEAIEQARNPGIIRVPHANESRPSPAAIPPRSSLRGCALIHASAPVPLHESIRLG